MKDTEAPFTQYVFSSERLRKMHDDTVEIISKMVDNKNSITNAEKEKY